MLLASKQDFARLTLGMFVTSFPAYPLTMTYAGQAESPDGKADRPARRSASTGSPAASCRPSSRSDRFACPAWTCSPRRITAA
jgi:hypothetical protein